MSGVATPKLRLVEPEEALPGRPEPVDVPGEHFVLGTGLQPPFPDHLRIAVFAAGPFYGPEERFWQLEGVHTTATGYTGGFTENPSFEEVVTSRTGHAQAVLVVYDPEQVSYERLLDVFWDAHDPTQGPRQGNKVGTEYRSVIFCADEDQREAAEAAVVSQRDVHAERGATVTTEVLPLGPFYYAEELHQQHLAKHPLEAPQLVSNPVERAVRAVARRIAAALPERAERRIYDVYWVALYLLRVARVLATRLRGTRDCVMVYDLKVSAMAFGEFATFCLLARLFGACGLHTHVVLVDDEWREDFRDLGPAMSYKREQFGEMLQGFGIPGRFSYATMGHEELRRWRDGLGRVACYPPRADQDERVPAYYWSWPMLEATLRLVPFLRRRVVLRRDTIARNLELELPRADYLLLAVRQASLLPDARDVTPEDYRAQLALIRRHFPDHDVYVASDAAGTEVIREWDPGTHGVRFARDFSQTFTTHVALAMGAAAYVQVRGGGLSIPLAFSQTPWFLAVPVGNEINPWVRAVREGGAWCPPWGSQLSRWWPLTPDVLDRVDDFLAGVAAQPRGAT